MPRRKLGMDKSCPIKQNKRRKKEAKTFPISPPKGDQYLIGQLLVGSTFNIIPERWLKSKITFLCTPDEVDRIVLKYDEISVIITLILDTELLKDLVRSNSFYLIFNQRGEEVYVKLYFKNLPLPKFNKTVGNCVKNLFQIIFNTATSESDEHYEKKLFGGQEITELYKVLAKRRKFGNVVDVDVQHRHLVPTLRPYQKLAVKWMISVEKNSVMSTEDYIHPLYVRLQLPSNEQLYLNKFSGYVTSIKPTIVTNFQGGILAEEMGLGKTVEFLALILNNRAARTEETCNEERDSPIIIKRTKSSCVKTKISEVASTSGATQKEELPKGKKKSVLFTALKNWYDVALKEVTVKPSTSQQNVECICGDITDSNKIECAECGKFQHQSCLGYETRFGDFYCPSCWLDRPLEETSATLIVTPISLRKQWCNEIKKHVSGRFKVLDYEGHTKTPVYPSYLKEFDVVITTYNVLQAEFRVADKGKVFELRRKRKYDYPGCPLSRVRWLRLCLDEAQTVETSTTTVSVMAKKLEARYRWAVTGTPISKDIADLYGLIDYLQMTPYNDFEMWTNLLYDPYLNGNVEPLCELLSKVMWRSSKFEVLDQINIPKQEIIEHALEFSAVEKFFYSKEHALCREAFVSGMRTFDHSIPLAQMNKSTLKKILLPLRTVQQVCTHPNVVRGKYLATKKQMTTIKELLEALIAKNSTESEENMRLVVSSINGLAGIHLLLHEPQQAADEYRKVLQLSARFSKDNIVNIDKLLLIHAMQNLADLLEVHSDIPPTLHDATLRDDCKDLERKYIEKFINNTRTSYKEFEAAQNATISLRQKFTLKNGQWYSDGTNWISVRNFEDEFEKKIQATHELFQVKYQGEIAFQPVTVLYRLATWDEELTNERIDLIETIQSLFTLNPDEKHEIFVDRKLVESATECHLRPDSNQKNKKKVCPLCAANKSLKKYEALLFHMTKRKQTFEEMSLQGSWKPSSEELVLKALLSILKTKNSPEELVKDGETHINLLDNLKKEFKDIRKVWTELVQQVAAQDELDMCKLRLAIGDPKKNKQRKDERNRALEMLSDTLENKLETIHMLDEHELEYRKVLWKSDEAKGMSNLEKCLGVRSYLETLRKQQYEGQSPDPCPICHNNLDTHWSILSCGHNYCMDCIHTLMEQSSGRSLICCVCRQSQNLQDIAYIKSGTNDDDTDVKIRGNYSTKIEGILRVLFKLKTEDSGVKVLIFSTWLQVLKILKEAMELNGVTAEFVYADNLEQRIENFKDDKQKITALLLPINLGGKGLNLIEATHVIFVEPLLNPGHEMQAIGRIHRIGQTRPTFVHKFFIQNTIEESILKAMSTDAEKWDENKITLKQLQEIL